MTLRFRLATDSDDAELRKLFRAVEMEGDISIGFEREPNFFRAMQPQGDQRQVIVGEDLDSGKILGLGSRAISHAYVNGEVQRIAYLSDLRVNPNYRNGHGLVRAYRYLRELQEKDPVSLTYTVIFENNQKALSTIAQGRAGLPRYLDQGRWECPALWFGRKRNATLPGVDVVSGTSADLPRVVEFLNGANRNSALAPVHQVSDFEAGGRWEEFNPDCLFIAKARNEIVGVLGAWDQHGFKQTRIKKYDRKMQWASRLTRIAPRIFGLPVLPREGQYLHNLCTCFHAARDPEIFRLLLSHVHDQNRKRGYHFLLVGLHEDDPFADVVRSFPQTPFYGRLFTVDFDQGADPGQGVPYLENVAL